MSKYYKLIDGWQSAETFPLPFVNEKGYTQTKFFTLYPNTKYVEHIEDEMYMERLLKSQRSVAYDADKEDMLKKAGVPYEIKKCPVCGGRQASKLFVNVVEVKDDDVS